MKAITRRLGRLEHHLRPLGGKPQRLWVVCKPGWGLALDQDACLQILRECGFFPIGRFGFVDLCSVPEDLNAEQTERFLRENGATTCGLPKVRHGQN
jgi:hypothetical protein